MPDVWRLYLDECIEKSVLDALRRFGVDAESARSTARLSKSDRSQLAYACEQSRTLVTFDPDFFAESKRLLEKGGHHHGILMMPAREAVGTTIRNLRHTMDVVRPTEMKDQVRWVLVAPAE